MDQWRYTSVMVNTTTTTGGTFQVPYLMAIPHVESSVAAALAANLAKITREYIGVLCITCDERTSRPCHQCYACDAQGTR